MKLSKKTITALGYKNQAEVDAAVIAGTITMTQVLDAIEEPTPDVVLPTSAGGLKKEDIEALLGKLNLAQESSKTNQEYMNKIKTLGFEDLASLEKFVDDVHKRTKNETELKDLEIGKLGVKLKQLNNDHTLETAKLNTQLKSEADKRKAAEESAKKATEDFNNFRFQQMLKTHAEKGRVINIEDVVTSSAFSPDKYVFKDGKYFLADEKGDVVTKEGKTVSLEDSLSAHLEARPHLVNTRLKPGLGGQGTDTINQGKGEEGTNTIDGIDLDKAMVDQKYFMENQDALNSLIAQGKLTVDMSSVLGEDTE